MWDDGSADHETGLFIASLFGLVALALVLLIGSVGAQLMLAIAASCFGLSLWRYLKVEGAND